MRILVLGGGDLKIAYEAGVVLGLARRGLTVDGYTGTSAGAILATILAHRAFLGDSLETAAAYVVDVLRRLRGPADLVRKRSWLRLLWGELWGKPWPGVYDLAPLRGLLVDHLGPGPFNTRGPLAVVYVSPVDGVARVVRPTVPDEVLASASVPVVAGPALGCYDGGLRYVAPLKPAIDLGATELVVVAAQPAQVAPWTPGGLASLAARTGGLLAHAILEYDLATCDAVNAAVHQGRDPVHRFIPRMLIRPRGPFAGDMTDFTPAEVSTMINAGLADAGRIVLP